MAPKVPFPLVRKIWSILTPPQRRGSVVLFGFMLVGMVLETLGVGLVIPLVALLTKNDFVSEYPVLQPVFSAAGHPSQSTIVVVVMLGLVAVYFIKAAFLGYLVWRQTSFATSVQVQLSGRLFAHYLRQPYTFHLQRNSAQLLRNVVGEVSMFVNGGVVPGLTLLTELLVTIGVCTLLFVAEPIGAAIVVGVLGGAAFASIRLTQRHVARWGQIRQYHEGLRVKHLLQGLGGVKDVKLLGRERDFLEQYHIHNAASARVTQLQMTFQQFPRLWLELLAILGLAVLTISMLAQGRALVSVLPTLSLFALAAFRLMPSVNRALHAAQGIRFGLPVVNLIHSELQLDKSEAAPSQRGGAVFTDRLELQGVSYTYAAAARPALNNISIAVGRGESVGLIGASGAGKSTLVDVFLGLLTPNTGAVLSDGIDIQRNLRGWQDQIGYVPQSIFLTDDSLRRNVAFGVPNEDIDDSAVERALSAAQLDDFVASLPDGVETVVGERGVRLSGGQRQRIGIARALYHDPGVLVLDEATSSLDLSTERGVMEAVSALHGSKTIIIVAHRFSTVEHCDRLYRLDNGSVVEEGTPGTILPHKAGIATLAQNA